MFFRDPKVELDPRKYHRQLVGCKGEMKKEGRVKDILARRNFLGSRLENLLQKFFKEYPKKRICKKIKKSYKIETDKIERMADTSPGMLEISSLSCFPPLSYTLSFFPISIFSKPRRAKMFAFSFILFFRLYFPKK